MLAHFYAMTPAPLFEFNACPNVGVSPRYSQSVCKGMRQRFPAVVTRTSLAPRSASYVCVRHLLSRPKWSDGENERNGRGNKIVWFASSLRSFSPNSASKHVRNCVSPKFGSVRGLGYARTAQTPWSSSSWAACCLIKVRGALAPPTPFLELPPAKKKSQVEFWSMLQRMAQFNGSGGKSTYFGRLKWKIQMLVYDNSVKTRLVFVGWKQWRHSSWAHF